MTNLNNSDDKKHMDTQPSVTEQIRKYILSNLLSVIWSVSLLVGGLIFWVYFFQIQYFPDLSFEESGLLLPLAAITGAFLLLFMTSMFMLPYFTRLNFIRLMTLLPDKSEPTGKDKQKTSGELLWYFFSIFLAWVILYFLLYLDTESMISNLLYIWIPVIVLLGGHFIFYSGWGLQIKLFLKKTIICFKQLFNKNGNKTKNSEKNETKELILGAWIVSSFITLVPLLALDEIIGQVESQDSSKQLIQSAILGFVVLSTNFLFAYFREFKERNWWHWLIPLFAVLCLFYIVSDPLIPKMVMRKFHFGNFTAEQLIVEDKGCDILESFYLNPFHVKDQKFCQLNNVNILSRLGTTFYIEAMRQKCKPPWRCIPLRVTIPRQYVMSWNTIKPKH